MYAGRVTGVMPNMITYNAVTSVCKKGWSMGEGAVAAQGNVWHGHKARHDYIQWSYLAMQKG